MNSTLAQLAITHRNLARSWFELGGNVEKALRYNPNLDGCNPDQIELAKEALNFYRKFNSMEEAVAAVPFPKIENGALAPDYLRTIGYLFGEKRLKDLHV